MDEEASSVTELRDEVDKLRIRKEELKQQLHDKEAEMDELKETYRSIGDLDYFKKDSSICTMLKTIQ